MAQRRLADPGPDLAADELRRMIAITEQVRALGRRLGTDEHDTLAALASLAWDAPVEGVDALSEHDEAVLRRAGSLREVMPPFEQRASTETALAGARLLADALTVGEAARRLGVSDSRIRQRLAARTLLGVEGTAGWRLPSFQFEDGGPLRGLDTVLPAFPADVHPHTVQRLLATPHADLELEGQAVSPREWLRTGGSADTVADLVAQAFALP